MFDRWFKRGASAAALSVDLPVADDATERLHDAERRIAQLEILLQQSVIEIDRYRTLTTVPVKAPAKVMKPTKPAAAPKVPKAPKAPKPIKAPKMAALEFWAVHTVAVDKIRAEYGDNWKVAAPFGKTELVTLASSLRNYTTERGTKLKWPKDQRFPAAAYWPGGAFPEGVTANGDYARHDTSRIRYASLRSHVAWEIRERHAHLKDSQSWIGVDSRARKLLAELRDMGKPAAEVARDAKWYKAHLIDREARRIQALERACLTYGPQPLAPFADIADDMDLAEAAD